MKTFSAYTKTKAGYDDVHQTVKTLEKIAASHLHMLEKKMGALQDYSHYLTQTLAHLHAYMPYIPQADTKEKNSHKTLTVLITGDRGLVGDLWKRQLTLTSSQENRHLFVIGKKGQKQWPKSGISVQHHSFKQRLPSQEEITDLIQTLTTLHENNTYQEIRLLYIESKSLTQQEPVDTLLLPIDANAVSATLKIHPGLPIFDTSKKMLWGHLFQKYLKAKLEHAIFNTAISEFSARTVTTEHAAVQTQELIKKLFLTYSKEHRQLQTQKQLERFASQKTSV